MADPKKHTQESAKSKSEDDNGIIELTDEIIDGREADDDILELSDDPFIDMDEADADDSGSEADDDILLMEKTDALPTGLEDTEADEDEQKEDDAIALSVVESLDYSAQVN
jgi:hypothetical protein